MENFKFSLYCHINIISVRIMDDRYLKKFLISFKGYIEENWGLPFIGLCVLFLMAAAVCSLIGLSSLADSLVIYAYCVLIAGVILQLICFVKYRKKRDDSPDMQ